MGKALFPPSDPPVRFASLTTSTSLSTTAALAETPPNLSNFHWENSTVKTCEIILL